MKKVGIIGGLGPESTVDYYQSVISAYQLRIDDYEELPELFISSINMYKLFRLLENDQMKELINYLSEAVQSLEKAGADFVVMAANTPHIVFEQVQKNVQVPMISIVEETYGRIAESGLNKVGLLGTSFTMKADFFKVPFVKNGIEILVPDQHDQPYIHHKIVGELEKGIVNPETKRDFINIITKMIEGNGIQGVILGCTELPMLIKSGDLPIPVFNTMDIHVNKIVETLFNN